MADCKNLNQNNSICNCTYPGCPRHGVCCECLAYHRSSQELPACYFDAKGERTYDRSIENCLKYSRANKEMQADKSLMRRIKKAEQDLKAGKGVPIEKVREELGLV